jgi:biopolymer transport protein ExbD
MAARKPSERSHGGGDDVAELQLVPILAIMVILIPMLIYMFTFHQIRVQRITAPREGTSTGKKNAQKKKPLNLTVKVLKDGFGITWEDELGDASGDKMRKVIPLKTFEAGCGPTGKSLVQGCTDLQGAGCKCFDFATLYKRVHALKKKYSTPKEPEKRINLTAGDDVPWRVLSPVIDAVSCVRSYVETDQDNKVENGPDKRGEPFGQRGLSDYFMTNRGKDSGWKGSRPKYPYDAANKLIMNKVPGMDQKVALCEPLFETVVFVMTE